MGKAIDIRTIKLNKWYIPKSVKWADQKDPVILGCFDELEVQGGQIDIEQSNVHPFTAGYRKLIDAKSKQKKKLVDYSSQEQILFLNIGEENAEDGTAFTKDAVQEFWDKENNTSPYLFISMIHISHLNNLRSMLSKIKEVFGQNYLSYVSFDYCDIVLFARHLTIRVFLEKIRGLFVVGESGDPVIFDTFSMVSFLPNCVPEKPQQDDKFQATININVRDHKQFKEWYQKNIPSGCECYNIYGRHDISITNEEADTRWLMWIMELLHDDQNQKMFWTFETFIKVKNEFEIDVKSNTLAHQEQVYDHVQEKLQDEIEGLQKAIDHSRLKGQDRYILPVHEVRDCICGIVKNGFAEEFVCCIYESFLHFISYMKTEIENLDKKSTEYYKSRKDNTLEGFNSLVDDIGECYDKYFSALNTLVNSTMHSERQFVQATAFNAVFYSIPPKIMAFYNAYIYRIKQILMDKNYENQYTFLIYPSFSSIIYPELISLRNTPPSDGIFIVTINEESLYDIESVMYQMVHELAHQVGNTLRCRPERTRRIYNILVMYIMERCEIKKDTQHILQEYLMKDSIAMGSDTGNDFEAATGEYLQYISQNGVEILRTLAASWDFQDFSETYYREKVRSTEPFCDTLLESYGISEKMQKAYVEHYTKQYAELKSREFRTHLAKMDDHEEEIKYIRYIELTESVYRECYADLQMILLLAMNAEEYLKTFLVNLKIPMTDLLSKPENILRISTVYRTMLDCGLWREPGKKDDEGYQLAFDLIRDYSNRIANGTDIHRIKKSGEKAAIIKQTAVNNKFNFENGINLKGRMSQEDVGLIHQAADGPKSELFIELASGLYEYLLDVMAKSLEEYSKEEKFLKICELRALIREVLTFQDATEIFNRVEVEIDKYKKEGCGIKTEYIGNDGRDSICTARNL